MTEDENSASVIFDSVASPTTPPARAADFVRRVLAETVPEMEMSEMVSSLDNPMIPYWKASLDRF